MPRGKSLTEIEKGKIEAFKDTGLSNREIARKLSRSACVVDNFVNLGKFYGKIKRRGRKKIVDRALKARITALCKANSLTAPEIKAALEVPVSVRRIQQILKESKQVKWMKRKKKPKLTESHKKARLAYAKKYIQWSVQWRDVIFSDEKKFNLDGPDGCQYYWHSLNKSREVRFSRNYGGGSVMVWASFSYNGTSPLCWINGRMDSERYSELIENVLIPFAEDKMDENWYFQQDNASIHTSKLMKKFFNDKNIALIDHPSLSPDLNPIENLWGIMAKRVYSNGRQFKTVKELKTELQSVWSNIQQSDLHTLVESMHNRLLEVIEQKGGHTHY